MWTSQDATGTAEDAIFFSWNTGFYEISFLARCRIAHRNSGPLKPACGPA